MLQIRLACTIIQHNTVCHVILMMRFTFDCRQFKYQGLLLLVSLHVKVQHLALELGEGLLDPEGGEPHPGVPVPALRHQLGQAPEERRAVPPGRHIRPGARHTHNLGRNIRVKISVKNKLRNIVYLIHVIEAGVAWNKLIIRQLVVITLSNLQEEKEIKIKA